MPIIFQSKRRNAPKSENIADDDWFSKAVNDEKQREADALALSKEAGQIKRLAKRLDQVWYLRQKKDLSVRDMINLTVCGLSLYHLTADLKNKIESQKEKVEKLNKRGWCCDNGFYLNEEEKIVSKDKK